MKISDHMNVFTLRKKILLASKMMGVILMVSYVFSSRLPLDEDASLLVWLIFVALQICVTDLWMARFITKPVSELNGAARSMAGLDFSRPCGVTGRDEFGELSHSLNVMAERLQEAFSKLEDMNRKLEQDVEQKKRLLAERKELVDNLSHEMKTPLTVIRAYAEGLQDETDEAKRQDYEQVILAETERLSSLRWKAEPRSLSRNVLTLLNYWKLLPGDCWSIRRTLILNCSMNCRKRLSMWRPTRAGWSRC